jgi:hypothetical protein
MPLAGLVKVSLSEKGVDLDSGITVLVKKDVNGEETFIVIDDCEAAVTERVSVDGEPLAAKINVLDFMLHPVKSWEPRGRVQSNHLRRECSGYG